MVENEFNSKSYQLAGQLPTYCDEDTNNLGQITNISYNTRFAMFFKSMFLYKFLKSSNPQTRAFTWKWSQFKKLQALRVSYQHIMIKLQNKLGQVTNLSRNTRFAYFIKSIFLEELLKFPKQKITTFGWNRSKLKKLPTLAVSYQHILQY